MVLTGLCGEGVGEGDGDEEKDRDLGSKQRCEEGVLWCPGPSLSTLGTPPQIHREGHYELLLICLI